MPKRALYGPRPPCADLKCLQPISYFRLHDSIGLPGYFFFLKLKLKPKHVIPNVVIVNVYHCEQAWVLVCQLLLQSQQSKIALRTAALPSPSKYYMSTASFVRCGEFVIKQEESRGVSIRFDGRERKVCSCQRSNQRFGLWHVIKLLIFI